MRCLLRWEWCWQVPKQRGNDLVQKASICWQVLKGLSEAMTVLIAEGHGNPLVQALSQVLCGEPDCQAVWIQCLASNSSAIFWEPPMGWKDSHSGSWVCVNLRGSRNETWRWPWPWPCLSSVSPSLQSLSTNIFFFLCFFGLHLQHVPRLGVQSELQLPATATATATQDPNCVCNLNHNSRAIPAAYRSSPARGQVRAASLTCWARPWIKPTTSWLLVRFISAAPWQVSHPPLSEREGTTGVRDRLPWGREVVGDHTSISLYPFTHQACTECHLSVWHSLQGFFTYEFREVQSLGCGPLLWRSGARLWTQTLSNWCHAMWGLSLLELPTCLKGFWWSLIIQVIIKFSSGKGKLGA